MQHDFSEVFETDNEYWQKVLDIFAKNEKYEKKIVSNRNLHHKFPRSFSKKLGEPIDNDKDNLISLSLADHFLVHYYYYLLAKKGFRQAMATAFTFMAKKGLKYMTPETAEQVAKDYEEAKLIADQFNSEIHKGQLNPFFGKHHSEEFRNKMSERLKDNKLHLNKHHTEETRKNISETQKGKPHPHKGYKVTEEHKRKISEARKSKLAKKFEEHYGYFDSRCSKYLSERYYYKRYGKCSWEIDATNLELKD